MSPEQKRKFNTLFGGVFIATGVLAWGLTTYFALTPNPPKPAPVIGTATIDLPSCRTVLASLGYDAAVTDGTVVAHEALSANPKEQLQKATLASTVCKLPMKSFCMGEGCPRPGLTIVVAPTEAPKKTPAPAASANAAGDKNAASAEKASTSAEKPATQK